MYLTVKQQLNHLSKQEFKVLRILSHTAKNLANQALFTVRQHYFATKKYLPYEEVYKELKTSTNYKTLNSNMSQQILKEVDGSFQSFFTLKKLAKQGKYEPKKIRIPKYLPKDGFSTLVISFVRISNNELLIPFSRSFRKQNKGMSFKIKIPQILQDKQIKEIRIIPKYDARFFEIQYTYKAEKFKEKEQKFSKPDKTKALAIDLGINNLMTCVASDGKSFIMDGRKLKSINQWFNKQNARLQGIKDKQKIQKTTKRQKLMSIKRNNRINDCLSKSCKFVVMYCLKNGISKLVLGYNADFQGKPIMGKRNNQTFKNIPFGKIKNKFEYLCELYNIKFVTQEESYTSKASFWDKDEIPVYEANNSKDYSFSGKRIKRGLYRTSTGKTLNADVNGALNILRKSSVVALTGLYGRGEVNTPARIRVA